MNNSAQKLVDQIKNVMTALSLIRANADEAYSRYWGTSANTDIGAKADGDAVTVSSKLKKTEFVSGITLAEAIKKFFNNEAFSAAAYLNSCRTLTLGDTAASSVVSNEVESIGNILVYLANDSIEYRKKISTLLEFYSASELSAALGAMSSSTIMFGTEVSKSDIVAGLTCAEQFKKFLDNDSATQGDYKVTVALWEGH